jgi:hypothetical protein
MRPQSLKLHISPYRNAFATLESLVEQGALHRRWLRTSLRRPVSGRSEGLLHIWVAFSQDVDEDFVRNFRKHSTPATRLLVMNDLNERLSTDSLFTRLLGLPIRSPQRLYVADCPGIGKSHFLALLLQRLTSAVSSKESFDRILDARIEAGILRVVSTDFKRLDVAIAQIPALASADCARLAEFEIDEDGSFVYWPKLNAHLGWEQLYQIANPEAARKAQQKHREFNVRYGKAVQGVREEVGLKPSEIPGLSEKQLRRIESGKCRLTSNAIQALAKAHGLEANAYLQKLAEALSTPAWARPSKPASSRAR